MLENNITQFIKDIDGLVDSYKSRSPFILEITPSQLCNLKCSYCFEQNYESQPFEKIKSDQWIRFIYNIVNSDKISERFSNIQINFWGGEPTLQKDILEDVITEFYGNPRIKKFFLYSNGYEIENVIDLFVKYKDKIKIQVSYDGDPLHDMMRVTKQNLPTSKKIIENLHLLKKGNIDFGLKSTISPYYFKYLYESWLDMEQLYYMFNTNYSLTIDYHLKSLDDIYYNDLYNSLVKVSAAEMDFYDKNNKYLLNWFRYNRSLCTFGKNACTVNEKGKLYLCHGGIYEDGPFCFGDIFDMNIVDKIIHNYNTLNYTEPEECKNCSVGFCLRCNIVKFINSKKEKFIDRWADLSDQPYLCRCYQMVDKFSRSIKI